MKRTEKENRKNKRWLGLLMAALVFSSSAQSGHVVYAAEPEEEKEAETDREDNGAEDADAESDDVKDPGTEDPSMGNPSMENSSMENSSMDDSATDDSDQSEAGSDREDAAPENADAEEADTEEADKDTDKEEAAGDADEEASGDAADSDEASETDRENGENAAEAEPAETEEQTAAEQTSVSGPDAQAEEIPVIKDAEIGKTLPDSGEEEEEAVYDGIVIDGDFEDWAGVSKTDAGGSDAYQDFLEAVAVIQDGDQIYVYIRDTGIGAAAWSGPHGNGQFSLVTDLGYSVLFQLHSGNNGASVSISGVDGAECAYYTQGWGYSGEWEISIPVSELPNSRGSFAFGYYQAEPFIGEIADGRQRDELTGSTAAGDGENSRETENIVFDGLYGDWSSYPHTLIQYATSGTWEKYVDGEGALYSDGGNLYGHVVTRMNAHLTEHGEEMQYGVVLRINQDNALWFEFRLVDVDENGRINWNVNVADQENGTHEYYIVDTRGWSNAATLDEITQGNNIYGRMRITKSDISDEAEWKLDLGLIAEHFGLEETDMQVLEVKYERIGDRWLQTAGASTGPIAGILLSVAAAGSVMVMQRRKKGM